MRKRPVLRFLAALCITVAIYAVQYNFNTARMANATHRQLVREEHLTEQAGIPLNLASLIDATPPVAQDAGPIYEKLRTIWRGRASDEDEAAISYLCQGHLSTSTELSKARQTLKRQAHALSLVHDAVNRPRCVLQIHWSQPNPSDIQYPQLAIVRNAARYLAAESILMASDGRYLDAVRNASLGFKLAAHGAAGKSAIAYLVGDACDAIALGAMRKILYLYGDKPGVAALIHDEVERNFKPPSAAAGLRTEAVISISYLEYVRAGGWPRLYDLTNETPSIRDKILEATVLGGHLWDGMRNLDGIYIVRYMRKAIPIADRPFYEVRPALVALDTDVTNTSKPVTVAEIFLPTLEKLVGKRAQIQDDAQMVMLAAQLIAKHNRLLAFPSLAPLAIDMYTGKPLRYRREGVGFMIYTPGLDGNFDGGTIMARPKIAEYVFHYPMPPYYLTPEPKSP